MKLGIAICTILLSSVLASCGGGGSDGGGGMPAPTEFTYQLRNALVASSQETVSREFSASGTSSGFTVTASGSVAGQPLRSTTFEGQPAQAKDTAIVGTITVNGQTLPMAQVTTSFFTADFVPLGMSNGEYDVVIGTVTISQFAKLNDTGLLFSYMRYADASKTISLGSGTSQFAVLAGTGTNATLNVTTTDRRADNTVEATSVRTYSLSPEGVMVPLTEELTAGSDRMTLQYGRVL